jgi:hypothetical protein
VDAALAAEKGALLATREGDAGGSKGLDSAGRSGAAITEARAVARELRREAAVLPQAAGRWLAAGVMVPAGAGAGARAPVG